MRKFVSLALVLVMILAMSVPAIAAADPAVSAKVTGNGNSRQVEITIGSEKATFDYANGSKSGTYTVNGYEVFIEYSGNSVKSAKIVSQSTSSSDEKTPVAGGTVNPESNLRKATVEQTWNKTMYHCGTDNGGKRVVPTVYTSLKLDNKTKLLCNIVEIPDTTKWQLVSVEINKIIYTDPVCPECGSTEWVSFSNNSGVPNGDNMQFTHAGTSILIEKKWADGNPNKVSAIFDIYEKKADGSRGKLVMSNLSAGKYTIKAGTYIVAEREKPGYVVQPDQTIVVQFCKTATVKFVNEPKVELKGELSLKKIVVDGDVKLEIAAWLIKNGHIMDAFAILNDITFELYASDESGTRGAKVADGTLDSDSMITFSPKVGTGWYLVHEVLGQKASKIFDQADDLLIYFNAEKELITGNSSEFDYDVLYTIVNGYSWPGRRTLGYPGINNNGDLFYIGVRNSVTDEEYASFCAHAGSESFAGENGLGCSGYMVAGKTMPNEPGAASYKEFISALNYIEDNVGNLNDNRAVTQTVIWALLGAVDVNSVTFDNTNLTADEKAAVKAAITAAKAGYAGEGAIVDLVYMTCENHKHGFKTCQPQLVPVYGGEVTFDNTPKIELKGELSLKKTVDGKFFADWAADYEGDIFALIDDIAFELYFIQDASTFVKVADGALGIDGMITFDWDDFAPVDGWYLVKEVLSGVAAEIFDDVTPLKVYVTFDELGFGTIAGAEPTIETLEIASGEGLPVYNLVTGEEGATVIASPGMHKQWQDSMYSSHWGKYNDSLFANASFIWDVEGTAAEYGVDGSFIKVMYDFEIPGDVIDGNFIFACDNAAVVYVNDEFAGNTFKAMRGVADESVFEELGFDAFNPSANTDGWAWVYEVDITDFLKTGDNEIIVYAANSCWEEDTPNNIYTTGNNPCGLIFYGEATYETKGVSFDNKEKKEEPLKGDLNLKKTVDGEMIATWLIGEDYDLDEVMDIIDDITFNVYDKETGALVSTGTLGYDGVITFSPSSLPAGWYLIEEVMGDIASEIFEDADMLEIYVGKTSTSGVSNALYMISGDGGNVGEVVINDWTDGLTLQDVWTANLGNSDGLYEELKAIAKNYGVELAWVWENEIADVNAHNYTWTIEEDFYLGDTIVTDEDGEVKVYFGADDAVAIWVNGEVAAYSYNQLTRDGNDFTWKYPFGAYQNSAGGFAIYSADILKYLIPGEENTIKIDVMNQPSSAQGGEGAQGGNPSGLLLFIEVAYEDAAFNNTPKGGFQGGDDVNVWFYDFYENMIKWDQIKKGEDGVAPDDGDMYVEGYIFKGWSTDFTNVQEDTHVYAIYEPIVFYTDTWTGRIPVQGGNNGKIVVTVNEEAFTLTVNAQQTGTRTHNVDGFTILVTVNDNNYVTKVVVTATTAGIPVVINSVVSLTPGTGQGQQSIGIISQVAGILNDEITGGGTPDDDGEGTINIDGGDDGEGTGDDGGDDE